MSLTKQACLGLLLLAFNFSTVQAQVTKPDPANFDRFVTQVYTGSGADYIKPDTRRYVYMKELFEKRISYVKSDAEKLDLDSNLKLLSEVPMYNLYNPGLSRDSGFDPDRFNPFKYQFDFYAAKKLIYRIDGTEYLIVIAPQERKNQ
ncbi:hypothetical protein [Gilvibacter sp.]|uniref:hypothetical protein n=1 Tax=Gilvibacter sp. TaxID=2729997 RepID=UPI0025C4F6AB|nr:hypothetical protein [Gilvibacter sp.]NQX78411.1 hypothetical protein [Gilvibacter sp.]